MQFYGEMPYPASCDPKRVAAWVTLSHSGSSNSHHRSWLMGSYPSEKDLLDLVQNLPPQTVQGRSHYFFFANSSWEVPGWEASKLFRKYQSNDVLQNGVGNTPPKHWMQQIVAFMCFAELSNLT